MPPLSCAQRLRVKLMKRSIDMLATSDPAEDYVQWRLTEVRIREETAKMEEYIRACKEDACEESTTQTPGHLNKKKHHNGR